MRFIFTFLWIFVFVQLAQSHDGVHGPAAGLKQAEIEKKIETYQKFLTKNPADLNAHAQLGDLFEKLGRITGKHEDFANSERHFRHILTFDPEHHNGLRGLCLAQLAQHQFKKGLETARVLAEVAPEDLNAKLLLGDAHFFLGNYAEAGSLFHQVNALEENTSSAARLGQWFEIRGHYELAYEWMEKALQLVPTDNGGNRERAWVLTMLAEMELQTGKTESAKLSLQKALQLDPAMHYIPWRLATIHMHQNNLEIARRLLHDLIHSQERVSYMVTYGQLWVLLDRPDRAKFWFEKAENLVLKEIEHADFGHVRELVMLWEATGRNLDKALELALREYQDIRQDAEGAELLGWLYHLNGQSEKGLPYINRGLRLGYATPRFLLRAGLVNRDAGNFLQAAYLFKLAEKDDLFVAKDLKRASTKAQEWLKSNPGAIASQFKKTHSGELMR